MGISDPQQPYPDDQSLVDGLRRDDLAAFEVLVKRHGPRMLAVAQRYVRPGPDAEDVLQEAFLTVTRGISTFDGGSRLSTWLHRIVVNCALMRLRSRMRRPETLIPPEEARRASPPSMMSVDGFDRTDMREVVQRALEGLPELDRAVVRLRDIQGMTVDEVSRLLGVGTIAVKEHLHRARHTPSRRCWNPSSKRREGQHGVLPHRGVRRVLPSRVLEAPPRHVVEAVPEVILALLRPRAAGERRGSRSPQ